MTGIDFVIVGGGIGGSALAGALADAGAAVTVLERETAFQDRVRGEWMAPWGVQELQRLGLYERFMAAGGRHLSRSIAYDELSSPEDAEARAIPIDQIHPRIPGPLSMEHVVMQNEALAAAGERGATVVRGVSRVTVRAGNSPAVRFEHDGRQMELPCRLVVGADGRASTVRRQLGFPMQSFAMENLIAGLLIDGATEWPETVQATGKVGDLHYLVFPQGGGKVRLYAEFSADQRGRFAGSNGARDMLKAFDVACVRHSASLAGATPVGPCRSLPSQSSLVETPYTEGAVLIGDAAGYNDPVIGQGLSITLRDARLVADILRSTRNLDATAFEPYAEERRERMRRLRSAAEFITALNARFQPEDVQRRQRAFRRIGEDPTRLSGMLGAIYAGPETSSPEVFTDAFRESLFGAA
jgi:2-polyprenyl-6-methoxyphenol hydroxylase-like FAD-dependent oxidoreductase